MRFALLFAFVSAFATLSAWKPPPGARGGVPYCLTSNADGSLSVLRHIATSPDSVWTSERASLGLGVVPTTDVNLIADEGDCQNASARVDQLLNRPTSGAAVYVFTFGPRFIVDLPQYNSHHRKVYAFDSTWTELPTKIAF